MLLDIKKQFDKYNQLVTDYNKLVKSNLPLKINLPKEIKALITNSPLKSFDPRSFLHENGLVSSFDLDNDEFPRFVVEQLSPKLILYDDSILVSKSEDRALKILSKYINIYFSLMPISRLINEKVNGVLSDLKDDIIDIDDHIIEINDHINKLNDEIIDLKGQELKY